jgi:hypothetical protein
MTFFRYELLHRTNSLKRGKVSTVLYYDTREFSVYTGAGAQIL